MSVRPSGFGPELDERIARSAARLHAACGNEVPAVAVLLGSGWAPFAASIDVTARVPYAELDAFPAPGVGGHGAEVVVGTVPSQGDGPATPVLVLTGRRHTYEGGRADAMAGAIGTLAAIGCRVLLQTNAAGSLEPSMRPGSFMLIADHLNLVQASPLFAAHGDARFVDLREAYAPRLRQAARAAVASGPLALPEGVYAWVVGPQFETPAEIRMLRQLGAHAVGMSTVPETILARHAGLDVLAVSMFTNMACGLDDEPLGHGQTLLAARDASADAVALLRLLLPAIAVVAGAGNGVHP